MALPGRPARLAPAHACGHGWPCCTPALSSPPASPCSASPTCSRRRLPQHRPAPGAGQPRRLHRRAYLRRLPATWALLVLASRPPCLMAVLSLGARLAGGRAAPAPAARHHQPPPGTSRPATWTSGSAWPARATSSPSSGHPRRPVRAARSVLRVAAPLRGQRLARAADPAHRRATLLQVALADPAPPRQRCASACQELLDLGEQQERLIDGAAHPGQQRARPRAGGSPSTWPDGREGSLARRPEAGRRGIGRRHARPRPATGDPSLVESLVANLVDNALRHNLAGGRIEVSTAMTGAGGRSPSATPGPVIPPESGPAVPALPAARRRAGPPRPDTGWAWPSSAPSPAPTAPRVTASAARRRPRHHGDLPLARETGASRNQGLTVATIGEY